MKEKNPQQDNKKFPLHTHCRGGFSFVPHGLSHWNASIFAFKLEMSKKHLKLPSHPLGWERFTVCLQGRLGGQGRVETRLSPLHRGTKDRTSEFLTQRVTLGPRQNILSLGPSDISSLGLRDCALGCDQKPLMELLPPLSLSLPGHLLFCIFSRAVGNFHNQSLSQAKTCSIWNL